MTQPVVLAVCLGNICRSPTAEAALKEAARAINLPLVVRSAGTGDWHVGRPPDPRMRSAAAAEGLHLDGLAAQVDAASLAASHLVLAMDQSNLADLQRLAAGSRIETDIRLFREFDPLSADELDVPDPYYGGAEGFSEVVRIVRRTSRRVVELIEAGELARVR